MRSQYARFLGSAVTVIAVALIAGCRDRLPEGPSEDEILKAMHEDLSVSHRVADFMIKDHDGIELLAERLSKDPSAAGQLLQALSKKGGAEMAVAAACTQAAEWKQKFGRPSSVSTTTNAQELQRQPAGEK